MEMFMLVGITEILSALVVAELGRKEQFALGVAIRKIASKKTKNENFFI